MERLFKIIKKMALMGLFALLSLAAILYGLGSFDLIFLSRDLPISGRGTAVIEPPQLSEDDKIIQEQVGQLGVGDNLSGITQNQGRPPESGEGAEKDNEGGKAPVEIYYPSLGQALAGGYVISDGEYGSGSIFAEILIDVVMTRDQVKGQKPVFEDDPLVYEDGGEKFYNVGEVEDYRFSYEPYMGYLLINDKYTTKVSDYFGNIIAEYGHSELRPAYVRDVEGNPLFLDGDDRYFLFGEGGRKLYSGYVDAEDSVGVYFDYPLSFGKSDNELSVYKEQRDVSFIDELDMSNYYIRSWVDPDLAYWVYMMKPDYAQKVANVNPRFAIALDAVKAAIEEEKQAQQQKTEELTGDTEEGLFPEDSTDAVTAPTDSEIISDTADTSLPEETSELAESEIETEETTEEFFDGEPLTSVAEESETVAEPDEGTESESDTVIDTDTESESTAETKAPDPNLLIIERTLRLPRYAYGYSELEDTDALDFKWAKAYPFSEDRAAVVDDDGVLRYIDTKGNIVIDGTGTKMVTASRYIVSEYAEPLNRWGEESKGYIYFDEGLVRVRRIERDYTYRNLIYSDSDLLLYRDGSEFPIPHGYELVAYSEGILVLRGGDGKYGYYHKDGYWIAQPVYTEIRPFSEGLGVIGFLGGKKGVIDKAGNVVIPFIYEYITAPSSSLITLYSYEDGWKLLLKLER